MILSFFIYHRNQFENLKHVKKTIKRKKVKQNCKAILNSQLKAVQIFYFVNLGEYLGPCNYILQNIRNIVVILKTKFRF